jgi:hypothetical protein
MPGFGAIKVTEEKYSIHLKATRSWLSPHVRPLVPPASSSLGWFLDGSFHLSETLKIIELSAHTPGTHI